MQRTKNLFVRFLCLFLSVYMTGLPQAFAHTNTTNYGRVPITWPDLGHEGGALLQSRIVTGITQLSNNLLGRWTGDVTLANSASTTITHNFGLALTKLKVLVFDAGVQLTNAQVAADYVITQVNTNSYTVQNVSGGSKTIQVITLAFKGGIDANDLDPAIGINTTGNVSATKVGAKENDIELNDAATGTGADYKATIRRPSTGMTGNTVITVPSVTTTLVGRDSTDTLTNKTISDSTFSGGTADASAGLNRRLILPSNTLANLQSLTRVAGTLYYATDTSKVYYDNGTALLAVGSGSGSGGTNYVANGDFETDASGTVAYKDAAGLTPVDGTGGTPALTFTRSTTTPLRGVGSGLITKSAANLQGEGVSIDFTVDRADLGKPINFKFDLETAGAYTGPSGAEYMVVGIYDVTNATLVQGVQTNSLGLGKTAVNGWFLSSTSGSVYRLILHVAGTGTAAWTAKIDRVQIGDYQYLSGASAQDWTAYTPTITGFGTVSDVLFYYKITQDGLSIRGKYGIGTPTATSATISLPIPVDYSKVPQPGTSATTAYGRALRGTGGSGTNKDFVLLISSANANNLLFSIADTAGAISPLNAQNGNTLSSTGGYMSVQADDIPIVGYSSNTTIANRALDEWVSYDGTTIYGANGALVPSPGVGTGVTEFIVSFQTPQDTTQAPEVEYNEAGLGWVKNFYGFSRGHNSNSGNYVGLRAFWTSSTTLAIQFGNRGAAVVASNQDNGTDWASRRTAGDRFRVRKTASGAKMGFPIGSRNLIGDTTGTAIPGGMLGETISSFASDVGVTTTPSNFLTLTLTPGCWRASLKTEVYRLTGGTTVNSTSMSISLTSATHNNGSRVSISTSAQGGPGLTGMSTQSADPICVSSSTTLYAVGSVASAGVAHNFQLPVLKAERM